MSKTSATVWGYAESQEPERWSGTCATRADAIAEGQTEFDGEEFWVKSGTKPAPDAFLPDARDILEIVANRASDEVDDIADDYPDVGLVALDELDAFLASWADKYLKASFWVADGPPGREDRSPPRRARGKRMIRLLIQSAFVYVGVTAWAIASSLREATS